MTEWETKDSGKRDEYASGMRRDTQEGKARFDLCEPENVPYSYQPLTRFAELMARGLEKYGERNWEKADSWEEVNRFRGSALRHCKQWYNNEVDEDHMAATMFNLMAAEATRYKILTREEPNGSSNHEGNCCEGSSCSRQEGGCTREEGSGSEEHPLTRIWRDFIAKLDTI